MIVRRERPHPGAQLDLIEERDGYRYTAVRHRHPRRAARLPRRPPPRPRPRRGPHPHRPRHRPGPAPSRSFAINAGLADRHHDRGRPARLRPDPAAARHRLARAEPKTLRYRLLHVAARLTRGQRRLWLRIDRHWPWATSSPPRSPDSPRYPSHRLTPTPTRRAAGATGRTARRQAVTPNRHQPTRRRSTSRVEDQPTGS